MTKFLKTARATALAATALTPFVAGPAAGAAPAMVSDVDTSDPKALVDAINKALGAFQAKNDERLKLLESGKDDIVTRTEVETINAQITEYQESLDKVLADVGRMQVGSGSAANENLRANAVQFFTKATKTPVVEVEAAGVDLDAYAAYRAAFSNFIRKECRIDALSPEFRNALSVGDPDGAGWLVPTEVSSEMEKRIHDTSPMRQEARVITIGGTAWEAPWMTAKGTSGGWVGERQSRGSTDTPTVGMQRIETHEQYAYPEATQTMLDDGAIDVEQFLVEETQMEMGRTENTAFVSGDGSMKPRGFLDYRTDAVTTDDATRTWGKLQYVPVGAAGAFPTLSGIPGAGDADALITLIQKLHPTYRPGAKFFMNRSTEATVRKLKDGDGRYIVGFGDLRDNAFGFSILGTPVVNFEDMPDIAADSFSIAYGNMMRGYYIIDRIGFRVLRDPYTNKPYVGFYITKRTGGDVRNFDAIKLLKFAAS